MIDIKLPIKGQKLEKNNVDVEFRIIGEKDLDKVRFIRDEAAKEFSPDVYSPSSDLVLEEYIKETGFILGAWNKHELVAFAILEHVGASEYALALNWPLDLAENVASLQDCVVLKEYRGNSLQQILCESLVLIAEDLGKDQVMASVSPDNYASLNNAIYLGFITQGRHLLHGEKERFVLRLGIGKSRQNRAFILIDYTNDFIADDGKLTAGKPGQIIQEAIAEKITNYVQRGETVFVLNDIHDFEGADYLDVESWLFPPHNIKGTSGRELFGAVKKSVERAELFSAEHIIKKDKTKYSAFYETGLEAELVKRNISQVELSGVCTDICVLHTAIDAYNIGYDIIVDENCVASFDAAGHEFALRHFENTLGATVVKKI